MNILYINHYAGNPELGMEFRPFYLAKEWQENGHNALILAANFSHLRRKNPENTGFETQDNVNYYWIKTPAYKGNGFGRVLNIFSFVGRIFCHKKKILSHIKPDIVVASSTYPFDIFPAWWIAKTTKAKLVFEIHDLWPLSLTEIGGMSKYHPFVLLVGLAEKAAYKLPDKIISILPKTYQHAKKFGVKEENFIVIPNGIVLKDWEVKENLPDSHSAAITKLKENGDFLVGYAGAHGVANAMEYLIDAAKSLQGKKIHFVLIGDGQEKENLIQYAKKLGVDNVSFLGRINKNAIPTFLAQMDALYLGWQKQSLYRFGIGANKIFDYMMAERPVLHSVTAGNDPIKDAGCGISVEAENPAALVQAILELISKSPKDRAQMGRNGKEYVLANHDYKILAKDFLKILL